MMRRYASPAQFLPLSTAVAAVEQVLESLMTPRSASATVVATGLAGVVVGDVGAAAVSLLLFGSRDAAAR